MASDAADDEAGDLIFLALLLTGGYILLNYWRNSQAAATPGSVFAPAPPEGNPALNFLNVLVPMQLSPAGEAFIKDKEQFRANKYPDGRGHYSIGYGHQIQPGESFAQPITQLEADDLFDLDSARSAQGVSDALKVQVSQDQFDALVSLAYTIGLGAFAGSTLLRLLNAGDFAGAAAQFPAWINSSGHVNNGLVLRRSAEQSLFNS